MLSTESIISEISDVPREWVFEYYLKLNEKLCGQDIKIKSPFNLTDKNPSMCVFWSQRLGSYQFKDFSADKNGDGVNLVKQLFNLTTRGEAAHKIILDYNEYKLANKEDFSLRNFKVQQRYKVIDFVKTGWNKFDQKYWTQFHIGSKLLEYYKVFPLESYKMSKTLDNGEIKELEITGRHNIYGYFREDGTLYKIYQPLLKDNKFLKVRDYIQGTDQLTYKAKYLIITSSLKDLMAFTRLGYKEAECVAPSSEGELISGQIMNSYKLRYAGICTLFDNDDAGIKAMKKYQDAYGIKGVSLPLSKDLSDSMRDNTLLKVKEVLTPLLKQALK
jgi:hypothetical protein